MQIENIINGVGIECHDEQSGKAARVIIRDPTGKSKAIVEAVVVDGFVSFNQTLPAKYDQRRAKNGTQDRHSKT